MRLGVFFAENPQNQPDVKVLSLNGSHYKIYTPVKHIIFGFIVFIHHNKYVQITQTGTYQYMMYHNIQTLLDMSQRSSNPHILILHLSNLR